ncbi:hypothetical protein [Acetobacter conturbans]|uniref:Uncharacterized protein n=1 Tax=Acetobacter conturbans TaxID=1737472 RepID=A0ABX0K0X9_9PROT|nr:hypothetical protein [Acetobacter conturbans]NHN89386.1 hypothetical protein [Acetobacter conturbans]
MIDDEDNAAEAQEATQPTGWVVRLLDLSGGAEDNIIEDIKGFPDLEHASAFARAYVRDNIEICRAAGASSRETLDTWFAFGENAEILDAPDGWKASTELNDFIEYPATPEERDWRSLDPRHNASSMEEE